MLREFLPEPDIVLQLKPEELAIPLLRCIIHEEEAGNRNSLILENFINTAETEHYGGDQTIEVLKSITETWLWLTREIMIAPRPREGGIVYVTRRGKELAEYSSIDTYVRSNMIPRGVLDPRLASKIQHLFIRGDYDTAVFQAFKEVEIRVRERASLSAGEMGRDLMRRAFHAESGELADRRQLISERQATRDLFVGAIGLFKNPSSHRDVNWEDPAECVELIYLANHLLRIVDKHASLRRLPQSY